MNAPSNVKTKDCDECQTLQNEFRKNPGGKPSSINPGLALAALTGGAAALLTAICGPFVTPALRRICLPFVPATPEQIRNVFAALGKARKSGRGANLVDIGSGDGRIVIEAAKRGFSARGIELNPWLVIYSKVNALKAGIPPSKAGFARRDLWKFHLGGFDNVVIFGVEQMVTRYSRHRLIGLPIARKKWAYYQYAAEMGKGSVGRWGVILENFTVGG